MLKISTIKGMREFQDANRRRLAALKPRGELGRLVKWATASAHRYAVGITHVDTGALKNSHLMKIKGLRDIIYLNPRSHNPKSGQRPAEYGLYEHARGGSHAFYDRTAAELGPRLQQRMMQGIARKM